MIDKNSQIKDRIFSAFLPITQQVFRHRKAQITDDAKAFQLFLEMVQYESVVKNQVQQKTVTVTNQSEEKLKFLNGVVMKFDESGKPYFDEA